MQRPRAITWCVQESTDLPGIFEGADLGQVQGWMKSLAWGMRRLLGSVSEGMMGREEDLYCLGSGNGTGKVVKTLVLPPLIEGAYCLLLTSLMPALQPENSVLSA